MKFDFVFRCMYNEYFFVQLMCGVNQTNRFIVCCSQRNYCNDLDAYSKDIRHVLGSSLNSSKFIEKKIFEFFNRYFSDTSSSEWVFSINFNHYYFNCRRYVVINCRYIHLY